jgi:hypothetical protein
MGERVQAVVTIWEQILPVDRGQRYQVPLEELLAANGRGEVVGAGTQLTDTKEIDCVEIEDDDELIGDVVPRYSTEGTLTP